MRSSRPTVLALARRRGIPIGHPCRGLGICCRCLVDLRGGAWLLAPPDERERRLLAELDAAPSERLACLARVRSVGTIELRVGGARYRLDPEGPEA